jgi:hypothetical protein
LQLSGTQHQFQGAQRFIELLQSARADQRAY